MGMDFNKKNFGLRLKEIRKGKGYTQENLCDIANIDISNYSKMETGKVTPSLQALYKILKGADIEPNELFEYEHLSSEKLLDEKIKEIYSKYSLSKKQFLYKFMRSFEDYNK